MRITAVSTDFYKCNASALKYEHSDPSKYHQYSKPNDNSYQEDTGQHKETLPDSHVFL